MLLRALIVSLGYLCDHIETCGLYCDKSMNREAGRFTRRKGLRRSFTRLLGLSLQQL